MLKGIDNFLNNILESAAKKLIKEIVGVVTREDPLGNSKKRDVSMEEDVIALLGKRRHMADSVMKSTDVSSLNFVHVPIVQISFSSRKIKEYVSKKNSTGLKKMGADGGFYLGFSQRLSTVIEHNQFVSTNCTTEINVVRSSQAS